MGYASKTVFQEFLVEGEIFDDVENTRSVARRRTGALAFAEAHGEDHGGRRASDEHDAIEPGHQPPWHIAQDLARDVGRAHPLAEKRFSSASITG